MKKATQITTYQKSSFTSKMRNGKSATHDIYTLGNGKKVLILIQELPGIGQETLALADRFVAQGYTVVLPHLFGPIGKTATFRNLIQVFCMRKEFTVFAKNAASPIVDYLSDLCMAMKTKHQVKGVAVIGMCLTGNFAISLMASDAVLAGFASQPSLPILTQGALQMSEPKIATIKNKLDKVGPMHCGRFKGDKLCTGQKFDLLQSTFNTDDKERMILHQLPGNRHAILTLDFVDKVGHPTMNALQEVITYFDDQLS